MTMTYPIYDVSKGRPGQIDSLYFGFHQATAESPVDWTPTGFKTKRAAMTAILEAHPRLCSCGCGEPTKGGEFRMGHDARHKSNLIKEALSGTNEDAVVELDRRGWTSFLDKAREIAARPKAEPRPRAEVDLSDAEKALRAHDRLRVMKAAGVVLKGVGQYHRASGVQIRMDSVEEAISIIEGGHPDLLHGVTEEHWSQFTDEMIGALKRNRMRFEDGAPFATWLDSTPSAC